MRKVTIITGIFIFLIAGGAIYYFHENGHVIRFSEKQIQEKLNEKLPLTKTYFFIFEVTFSNPSVCLTNGSKRVNAGIDIELNIRIGNERSPLKGRIDASSGVSYLSEQGEFYLTDPEIEKVVIQGVPEKYTDKVNTILTNALVEYYADHPIYTLNKTDIKQAATKMILKDVIVENNKLVVTLGI